MQKNIIIFTILLLTFLSVKIIAQQPEGIVYDDNNSDLPSDAVWAIVEDENGQMAGNSFWRCSCF